MSVPMDIEHLLKFVKEAAERCPPDTRVVIRDADGCCWDIEELVLSTDVIQHTAELQICSIQ